jgi:hypothetical protein
MPPMQPIPAMQPGGGMITPTPPPLAPMMPPRQPTAPGQRPLTSPVMPITAGQYTPPQPMAPAAPVGSESQRTWVLVMVVVVLLGAVAGAALAFLL